MIPGKLRMGEVYADVYGSITFATFGVTRHVQVTASHDAVTWTWRSASDVCRSRRPYERMLWVRRCHEDLLADKKTASTRGYAISACPSQNLRPTPFER